MALLRQGRSTLGAFIRSPLGVRGRSSGDLIYVPMGVVATAPSGSTRSSLVALDLATGRIVHGLPTGTTVSTPERVGVGSDGKVYHSTTFGVQNIITRSERNLSASISRSGLQNIGPVYVTPQGNAVLSKRLTDRVLPVQSFYHGEVRSPALVLIRDITFVEPLNGRHLLPWLEWTLQGPNIVSCIVEFGAGGARTLVDARNAETGARDWINDSQDGAPAGIMSTYSPVNAVGNYHFVNTESLGGQIVYFLTRIDVNGVEQWRTRISGFQISGGNFESIDPLPTPADGGGLFSGLPPSSTDGNIYASPSGTVIAMPWLSHVLSGGPQKRFLRIFDGSDGTHLSDYDLDIPILFAPVSGTATGVFPGVDVLDDGRAVVTYMSAGSPSLPSAKLFNADGDVVWDVVIGDEFNGQPRWPVISRKSDIS